MKISKSVISSMKAIGYILLSVLMSQAVIAAFGDWLDNVIPDKYLVHLINIMLVLIAKEVRDRLPETNRIKNIL